MRTKSLFSILITALAVFFLNSACLEITTETTVNADGSGSQMVLMDMSKLIEKMGPMMFDGETPTEELFAEKMGAEMMGDIDSMGMATDNIDGLSNFNAGIEGYAIKYSMDFRELSDLQKFGKESAEGGSPSPAGLGGVTNDMKLSQKGSKTTLSWRASMDDMKEGLGAEGKDPAKMLEMMRGMFEGMKATSIFHFPGAVKKVSDKDHMKVSKDKRTVIYQADMIDFLDGKIPEDNSIVFKQPKK